MLTDIRLSSTLQSNLPITPETLLHKTLLSTSTNKTQYNLQVETLRSLIESIHLTDSLDKCLLDKVNGSIRPASSSGGFNDDCLADLMKPNRVMGNRLVVSSQCGKLRFSAPSRSNPPPPPPPPLPTPPATDSFQDPLEQNTVDQCFTIPLEIGWPDVILMKRTLSFRWLPVDWCCRVSQPTRMCHIFMTNVVETQCVVQRV